MRWLWPILLIMGVIAPAYAKSEKRALGDINGDGVKDVAIEEVTCGSSCFMDVVIRSANRTIFTLEEGKGLALDSCDGYTFFGSQIVVWQADWTVAESKWSANYYLISLYSWNRATRQYVLKREGFTTRTYQAKAKTYEEGKRELQKRMLAIIQSPQGRLVWSRAPSFREQACQSAKQLVQSSGMKNPRVVSIQDLCRTEGIKLNGHRVAKAYWITLKGNSPDDERLVEVRFYRNSKTTAVFADGD